MKKDDFFAMMFIALQAVIFGFFLGVAAFSMATVPMKDSILANNLNLELCDQSLNPVVTGE